MKTAQQIMYLLILLLVVGCNNITSSNGTPNATLGYPLPTSTINESNLPLQVKFQTESIYIGEENGKYLVFSFDHLKLNTIDIGKNCRILENGLNAVCDDKNNLFSVSIINRQKQTLPVSKPYSWQLNYENRVDFTQEVSAGNFDLFTYDLKKKLVEHILMYKKQDWVLDPIISNNASYKIGGHTVNSTLTLAKIDSTNYSFTNVGEDILGEITDIAWSPIDEILGVGSTDIKSSDILPCTTTMFSILNAKTGKVKQIAHSPDASCYEYFWSGYTRNIWSPDGNKIALIAGKNICLLDILADNQKCFNLLQEDETIKRLSWSPDSWHIAYLAENMSTGVMSLHIYSLKNDYDSIIQNQINLDSAIVDFLWVKP